MNATKQSAIEDSQAPNSYAYMKDDQDECPAPEPAFVIKLVRQTLQNDPYHIER